MVGGIMGLTLLLWLALPKPSFWGIDSGIKWVGCQAFAQTGSISLPYQGASFDPEGKFRPYPMPFSIVKEEKLIPAFPPLFMVLGGIFNYLLGKAGAFILPLLGGWLLVLGCRFLWARFRPEREGSLFLVMVALGSPLLFYTLELWEHVWAAALLVFSTAFTSSPHRIPRNQRHQEIVWGGILLSLATGFRAEAFVWGVVTIFLWGYSGHSWRSLGIYLMGIAGGLIPILLVNYWQGGSPFPLHLATNYEQLSPDSFFAMIKTRLQNLYDLLLEGFPNNLISLLGIVPLLGVILWSGWRHEEGWYIWLLLLVGGVWLYYIVLALREINLAAYTQYMGGLLWVMPFATLGLLPLRGERRRFWRLMWYGTFLAILLAAALAPRSGGIHWGPRLITPFIPLGTILATTRAQRWWRRYPSTRPVIVLLIVISLLNQAVGYGAQMSQHRFNKELNRWAVMTGSRPIITRIWWLAGDCALASYRQPWFYTKGEENLRILLNNLRNQNVSLVSCAELPPYVSDETWWRLGAEHSAEDYFLQRGGELRRTHLRLIGTGAPPP